MSDLTEQTPRRRVLQAVGWSAGILLLSAVAVAAIQLSEPEVTREGAVKRTAMLVQVTDVERGTYTPSLEAMGRVRATQSLALSPRVSGQIVGLSERFVPGRVVAEGDVLVRLDPADAEAALVRARSAVDQAAADVALEDGRQSVAKTERAHIEGTITAEQEALILREPQRRSARAALESARAAATQAELDLARTRVLAPFDALVVERSASVGALVSPGAALGQLLAVDRFWVELTLPVSQLRHLARVDGAPAHVPVVLRDRAGWQPGESRTGVLDGVVESLDETTRLARLLVVVEDPLARSPEAEGPPLVAGTWVQARIPAAPLDAVRIDRALLRKGDTVWVMEEGALRIRPVEVAVQDAESAYVVAGLSPGDQVVTTNLSTVSDGAPLRIEGATP